MSLDVPKILGIKLFKKHGDEKVPSLRNIEVKMVVKEGPVETLKRAPGVEITIGWRQEIMSRKVTKSTMDAKGFCFTHIFPYH